MKWFKSKSSKATNLRQKPVDTEKTRVFSYYTASKNQLNKFDRQTQAVRNENDSKAKFSSLFRNWFSIFSFIALIAIAGYILTLNRQASIDVRGQLYRSNASYKAIVDDVLNDDIRAYTKPTLRTSKIEQEIKSRIPEAKDIKVETSILGHRPKVTITNDMPLAVFSNPNGKKMLFSERGRLLLSVEESSIDTLKLPIIENRTGVDGKAGEQFLSPEEAGAFANLLLQEDPSTIGLRQYILPTNPKEIYSASSQSRGYEVRYLLNSDIALQHGVYLATIKKLQNINILPSAYIDVRLVEKVYFK